MKRCTLLLTTAIVLLAMAWSWGADKPADWPQFRGPERNGISQETGLLHSWTEKGPPVLWTASGLGEGYSSISIANGHIYTMGDRQREAHVIALDLANGKEVWAGRV